MKQNIAIFLLSLIFLVGCQQQKSDPKDPLSNTPEPAVTSTASSGEPSPKFNLTAPDGSSVKFDPAVNPDNEIFLILFWSYRWDPNVKTLMERASELHERYAPRGLTIIAVSYDEEPSGLRKYLLKNTVPFDVAVGADTTAESFAVTSIPTSILVDANGRMVERWEGYYSTEQLSEKISPYLPGRSGNSDG